MPAMFGHVSTYALLVTMYLALSAMTGVLGRHTRVGFWGFFFLSLLVTPLLPWIALFLTSPAGDRR